MEENELVGQSKDSNSNNKPTLNIFQIMDEIVRQLNKTKKMFLIMIVSVIVVVPLTFIVTFALIGGPSFWNDGPPRVGPGDDGGGGGPPDSSAFGIARGIVIAFLLAWIVVGIRQWFVLSKWTQRYEIYKELQKKIDEKLDYESGDNNKEKEEK
jgi:Na+-driven multidrug efflux pump